jgi:hypothetical protein
MKISSPIDFSTIKRRSFKAIGGLLVAFLVWQGISISHGERYANDNNLALAANPITDSPAKIVEKVKDRVEGGKDAAIKDGVQMSRTENPRLKIERGGDADKSEKYVGDTPEIVQKTADRNSQQAEEFSRKTTNKVKNFFGF